MTPSERISIYLPDDLREQLGVDLAAGDSVSGRIAAVIDRYMQVVGDIAPDLDRSEWTTILGACNGWATRTEPAEILIGAFYQEVADYVTDLSGDERAVADVRPFLGKIAKLTPAEVVAIVERAEAFWRHSDLPFDEALAAAGIAPADA